MQSEEQIVELTTLNNSAVWEATQEFENNNNNNNGAAEQPNEGVLIVFIIHIIVGTYFY